MLRRTFVTVMLAFAAFVAIPVLADEVVHFTNGTSLPIRSHRVENDMVTVDLGSESRMSFPTYMVDKIESAGRQVYLNPTYHPTNQAVAGTGRQGANAESALATVPDTTVTADGSIPARFLGGARGEPVGSGGSVAASTSTEENASNARVNSAMGRIRPVGNRAWVNTGQSSAEMNAGVGPQGSKMIAPDSNNAVTRRSGAVRFGPRTDGPAPATPPTSTEGTTPPAETPAEDPPSSDSPSSD